MSWVIFGRLLFLSVGGALLGTARAKTGAASVSKAKSPSGHARLFLDASVVEEQHGLKRTFHPAKKYSGNPVLSETRPWEAGTGYAGPYLYGTVLHDGRFRMWYRVLANQGPFTCYAESADGIHWNKPNLGLVTFQGNKSNNIVRVGGGSASVILNPNPENPDRRYLMFYYQDGHAWAEFSPDGIHWSKPDQPPLFSTSDVLNVFHDPYRSRFVATWKTHNRRGRAVGVAWSADGRHWVKPLRQAVFGADDLDPDATQIYGMPVFPYAGLYIGLPWVYHARYFKHGPYSVKKLLEAQDDSPRTVDVQFAWSWDLINWTRPPKRRPFLPLGKPGAFDDKMIYTARSPVRVGNKFYFYYGGWDRPHDVTPAHGAIGLATLRLDGFCSMDAGHTEGWLITRREVMKSPAVRINARTGPRGYVTAELLTRHNRVIPGFSRRQCLPFKGDAVGHLLRWKTKRFPPRFLSGDKKIRFYLKDAELYSYRPAE